MLETNRSYKSYAVPGSAEIHVKECPVLMIDKTLRCPCVGSPISFNFFLSSLSDNRLYTSFGSAFRLSVFLTQVSQIIL